MTCLNLINQTINSSPGNSYSVKVNDKEKYVVAFALAFSLIVSCTVSLPVPTDEDALLAKSLVGETNLHELTEGRKLYGDRCGNCHRLYSPVAFSPARWEKEIYKMKDEAKLDEQEYGLITKYLLTMSQKDKDS